MILTSERLNNSDMLAETLKVLTINDAVYYNSEKNDAEGDPRSNPKVATHTSDKKKRKVVNTTNGNLRQKVLSNRTLPIITTIIDHMITDRVDTCGGTTNAHTMPTTNPVITNAARSSARVLRNPRGHISRTEMDGTTPRYGNVSETGKGPVLIGGTI